MIGVAGIFRAKRNEPQHVLVINPRGLSLHKPTIGRDLWSLQWSEIEEVVTFKVDLLTTDLICVGLKSEHESDYRVCDEETPGWNDVVTELQKRFDTTIGNRLLEAMRPPFETNFTILWTRQIIPGKSEADQTGLEH